MTSIVSSLVSVWARLTAFVRRRRIARDIDDELAFHLAMREAERRRLGEPPEAAGRHARRTFGNVTRLREETGDMWTFPSFESIVKDVRFALRTLRRTPGFTVVAVTALAIGIGSNTAMFSMVDAMFLRGLPYPESDRLVVLIGTVQRAEVERRGGSYPDFLDWRAQAASVEAMAAYVSGRMTLEGEGDPERIAIEAVSASYFDVLGVPPVVGRAFRADEDDVAGRNRVVVLSDGLWKRAFGGDPSVVGRSIRLGAAAWDVVGVAPPGFAGLDDQAEMWIPFTMGTFPLGSRGDRGLQVIARLSPGVSIEQARTEFDTISTRLEQQYPDTNEKRGVEVSPLSVETFGDIRPMVTALTVAVGFVLLIACANVANLLISRSEAREREMAVRAALGAGRARLLRQLATESLVLAALGALAGLVVAQVSVGALLAASPITLPSFVEPALSVPVLLFTTGVTLVCGLLLGLAPAMHARAARLNDALKSATRGTSRSSSTTRRALVVAEVGLAVVLLVGAGLMIRTVQNLMAIDPGFETDAVLTLNVSVPRGQSEPGAGPDALPPFVVSTRDLVERLAAVPGVEAAALSTDTPLTGGGSAIFYTAEGDANVTAESRPRAYVRRVTPGFFDTMRMPLVAGRTFHESELAGDSTVVIVGEGVVRRFWPGADPIGRRIKQGGPDSPAPWLTIVGVVPDVRYRALPENPTADPDLYFPYVERGVQSVMLRTSVEPASAVSSVRAAIRELDEDIVVYGVTPVADLASNWTSQSRFTTWVLGIFATTALLLAVVGIYGVMSYLVAERVREFGIRLALGATRRDIVGAVLGQGVWLVAAGIAAGLVAAAGLARVLESLLFGVGATDVSAAGAVLLLACVALVACVVPAVRATRIDPVQALRAE